MLKRVILLCTGVVCCASGLLGEEAKEYPSDLAGHALLEAKSFIKAPSDAPESLKTSGKYTTLTRTDKLSSIEGLSGMRPTGVFLPFDAQPLQGHSGIKYMKDDTLWLLTDNGAGSKANSPDFMLYLNHYKVDFKSGKFKPLKSVFLYDEDKKVPFHIVNEGSKKRYLTGADFDTESFQIVDNHFWIGDEFGPYLIKTDMNGKVLAVFETLADGKTVHSTDHYAIKAPDTPNTPVTFEVKRSKGFEGMAASIDGSKLYPIFEGALYDANKKTYENDGGKEYLRILEFDVRTQKWTGRFWKYPLEKNGNAIGDFNMIDKN
ncbi:MAG: esterase-like activity of phytase family protein, partial [Endomicrobium sp.]|nr:esterase-like activity of phytase family protein [Endomicrobium sp.]